MEVDELAKPGDILRALVLDSGDVVLVNEELNGDFLFGFHLLDVDDGSVAESAFGAEAIAALLLHLRLGLAAAAKHIHGSADHDDTGSDRDWI